jgi:hypothetical protein
VTAVSKYRQYVFTLPCPVRTFTQTYGRIHRIVTALITREYGCPWRAGGPRGTSDQMDHGMETRMLLREHFIGALTLAFIAIACASVNAISTDGAADEHAHHHAAPLTTTELNGFATANQLLAELYDLSQLHTAR